MPTLLHVDSSPSPISISRQLTRQFAETWRSTHSGGSVIYRDLVANPPKLIDASWIGAAHSPKDSLTGEQKKALAQSEELINELKHADEYVFGVAMHNFSIPSVFKLWIDQVVRAGNTFTYDAQGPKGLLHGKKATVLVASGGVYEYGTPGAGLNYIEPYLKSILGFIGVTDVRFISASGAAKLMSGAVDRDTFLKATLEQVRAAAA
jgi:FMN-dependent NADH-azoreductase